MFINKEQFNFDENKSLKKNNKLDEKVFQIFNQDNDNKQISTKEVLSVFEEIDANKDGNLTSNEIEKVANKKKVSAESLKNFLNFLKDGVFKAKGKISKIYDSIILKKDNGSQITTFSDGKVEIITAKKNTTVSGEPGVSYSKTISNPDGTYCVEQIEESTSDIRIIRVEKRTFDSDGNEIACERNGIFGGSSGKITQEGLKTTIKECKSGLYNTLVDYPPQSYYKDENDNVYNSKNNTTFSINLNQFSNLFDKNGKLNANVEFPIKTDIQIKMPDNTTKTIELTIEDKDAILANNPLSTNVSEQELLEILFGRITESLSNLEPECLEDLLAEINTIEIGKKSSYNSGIDASGEYDRRFNKIRLHSSTHGITTTTLLHELGHGLDEKLMEYDTEKKFKPLFEKFVATCGIEANAIDAYALTDPQEFFAEYYEYKYSPNKTSNMSSNLFSNKTIQNNDFFKELCRLCDEIISETRNGDIQRKQDFLKLDYSDQILNAFILEYYDVVNQDTSISTARELKAELSKNEKLKDFFLKNIDSFVANHK